MTYRVTISPAALDMLRGINDRRVRRQIVDRIDGLSTDPEKQGKALLGELAGCRSLRAAGRRYRVVYRVEGQEVRVVVVAVGIRRQADRRDVYALARRLVRLGLLEGE